MIRDWAEKPSFARVSRVNNMNHSAGSRAIEEDPSGNGMVKILITEGVTCFTTGANDMVISCRDCGTVCGVSAHTAAKGTETRANITQISFIIYISTRCFSTF